MRKLTLKEIQDLSLDILKEVDRFCAENGINYSLAYGTMIGAVRHKGYIPWDDDIDVFMLREDYDRFAKTFKSDKYIFIDSNNTPDCYVAFGRVCDDTLTTSAQTVPWLGGGRRTGLWIDIFPLDPAPDDPVEFERLHRLKKHLLSYSYRIRKSYAKFEKGMNLKQLSQVFTHAVFHKNRSRQNAADYIRYIHYLYSQKPVSAQNHYTCNIASTLQQYDAADVQDYVMLPFEDTQFKVFAGYDNMLRKTYGDYMALPPKKDQIPHIGLENVYMWK